ncbi:MAG TPA: hypothetical protein VFX59_27215 [Polyangiales bacterium]|nr:hypothetical protein [Polyangiales bacterium]
MRRLQLAFVLGLCGFVWAGFAAASASAQQAVDPDARAAFDAGLEAYERGQFAEALAWFERAHAKSPHAKLMFNIGRAADGDAQYARAIEAYEAYLAAEPGADNREFVESRIRKLRSLSAPVPQVAQPAPGPRVEAPHEGELAVATPERSDRPLWKRPWVWGMTGVVLAGVITTAVVLAARDAGTATAKVDETYMTLSWR